MRPKPPTAALAALLALALPAGAHEFKAGGLTVGHPYAPATAATARTAAGYFTVTNSGDAADTLIGVRADLPRVELHGTETDAAGVTSMPHLEALEIPPGATVTFAPRGLHVMFMGLEAPLLAGDTLPATLVFEKAGDVPVEFSVEARGAGDAGHPTDGHARP
jgi:copper(I)-binding protein